MPQTTTTPKNGNKRMNDQQTSNKPVHTVRFGSIKAAIWENQTANGPMHNVTLRRSFKDGADWKDSDSLGVGDLLVAGKALDEAHSWIHAERQRKRSESVHAQTEEDGGPHNEDSSEGS